ncbi:MAG: PIN domain-containing protein [Saprospiraceae bacterium]
MSAKCFLDSNIIIYAHTDLDLQKQQIAQQIISNEESIVSTQVLQETANSLFRKFEFPWADIQPVLSEIANNNLLHTNTAVTVADACRIAARYGFSFYDSLIIAAALEANAELLYSEDLQDGQVIDGALTIKTPF